jgi:PPP family 3-phenylpropionic acid transporter
LRPSPAASIRILFALMGVEVAAFIPFFSLFLRERGLRPDHIGFVLAAMSISGLLASTLWGHAADVIVGRLRALRATVVLAAATALVLNFVGSQLTTILLAATALSVCWAPIVPLADTLALQHLGPDRRPTYGRIRLWMSIGFAVAALAFGGLFASVGLGGMPTTFALALLVFVGWTTVADLPPSRPLRDRTERRTRAIGDLIRSAPRLAAILLAALLITTGVNAIMTFVPLRIGGLGGTPLLVGLAMSLAAAVEVPIMAFSARVIGAIGLRGAFAIAALQYAAAFAALSTLSSPVLITLVVATDGIGFALLYVSVVVAVDSLVPPALRATGQGLRQTVTLGLAPIIGSAGGGLVYEGIGPGALFLAAAGMVVAGGAIAWRALSSPRLSRNLVGVDRFSVETQSGPD